MKTIGQKDVHSDAKTLGAIMGRTVWLNTPLTSASWSDSAYSTAAKTLIDLSAVFGAPAGITGVYIYVSLSDSGSYGTDCWLCLSPNNTAGSGVIVGAGTLNSRANRTGVWVPCSTAGDIYYQINASGGNTATITLQVWGYTTRG